MAAEPRRIDGPTPNGAYALEYIHDDGTIEFVEYDGDDRVVRRTYCRPKAD